MKTERNWTEIARELNFAIKNYVGLTKMIVQIRNRAHAYDIYPEHEDLLTGMKDKSGKEKNQGLEQIKGRASRRIEKILQDFPIWTEWLVNVPGIGPVIGGQLVTLYYFKSVTICKDCGADLEDRRRETQEAEKGGWYCPVCRKEMKGEGILKYRIELRNFPTISSWWHFMGRHVIDGKMPKRKSGQQSDWSNVGRKIGFDIKEAFNKFGSSHKYKAYADRRKRYRENTHPDVSKGYWHNMAWNETVKLFLSHFWQVAHTLDGLEMTKPWCVQHGGHDESSIIPPFYFNWDLEDKEAA